MSESSSSPKRPRVDYDDSSGKEDHSDKYKNRDREHDDQSIFPPSKQLRKRSDPDEDDGKDDDAKAKSVNIETARREHTLVMRLTNKEQELQDCMSQIQEMKQAQTQNTAQLRSMLLDPAINLVFQRMAKEMDEHKEKLKQKQNELSAWKFTPDSQIGKRMMARCRLLLQENADLGKMISSGRTARLEGEIVLHKALVTEMKKNQKELDEFVGELEEDVEGMQGMIFMLQQQLKEAHEQISRLQLENEQLRTLRIPPYTEPGGSFDGNSNSNTPLHNWAADAGHESEPDCHASKLLISSNQSEKDADNGAVSENMTKRTSSVLPPALLTLSGRNRAFTTPSDQLPVAQNSEEDFNSDRFAFKVTPDSGMQTQEEEDVSMDTSDFSSSLNQQQPCDPDLQRIHSNPHLASRTTEENTGNDTVKKEKNSPRAETERGNIFSSPFAPQKSSVPNSIIDESLRTKMSTKSSKSSSDNNSLKSLQTLSESSASERTTESSTFSYVICNTVEGQRTRHPEEPSDKNIGAGRTNRSLEARHEKTSAVATTENETEERSYGDSILDENKAALQDSLGLNIVKLEDDKTECQLKLGLVNGSSSLPSQSL